MTEKLSERMEKAYNNMSTFSYAWVEGVEALEVEVKQQDGALMSQENRYWETMKKLKEANDRLAKAHEAMTNYHCETFLNFPDEAICGASKRPCKRYFLCEAMKDALAVGNEDGG